MVLILSALLFPLYLRPFHQAFLPIKYFFIFKSMFFTYIFLIFSFQFTGE